MLSANIAIRCRRMMSANIAGRCRLFGRFAGIVSVRQLFSGFRPLKAGSLNWRAGKKFFNCSYQIEAFRLHKASRCGRDNLHDNATRTMTTLTMMTTMTTTMTTTTKDDGRWRKRKERVRTISQMAMGNGDL